MKYKNHFYSQIDQSRETAVLGFKFDPSPSPLCRHVTYKLNSTKLNFFEFYLLWRWVLPSLPDSVCCCCCSKESTTVFRARSPSSVCPFISSTSPGIHLWTSNQKFTLFRGRGAGGASCSTNSDIYE